MKRAKILVIDDEVHIRKVLSLLLSGSGYDVDVAATGSEGLRKWVGGDYNLTVLDVGLPDVDGWTILNEIRNQSDAAVIMLTAHGAESSRVQGLRFGADDYVTKPFSNNELLARIAAVLRRTGGGGKSGKTLVDGPLTIDRVGHRATLDGVELPLSSTEWLLLLALVSAGGSIVTQNSLLEQAWHDPSGYGTDRVKFAVRRLRAEFLKRDYPDPIETRRGLGYRWKGFSSDAAAE